MPKFCANLTMLFNEVDFLDRFEKAAKADQGVEYLFPYAWKKEQLWKAGRLRLDPGASQSSGRDWNKASGASPASRDAKRSSRKALKGHRVRQGSEVLSGQLPGGSHSPKCRRRIRCARP